MATILIPGAAAGQVRTTPFFDGTAGSNAITLALDAYIVVNNDSFGLGVDNPGLGTNVWTVKIDGGVMATNIGVDGNSDGYDDGTGFYMYNFFATANNKVTIGTEGTVSGSETGIFSSVAADIVNSGVIAGGRFGFDYFGFAGNDGDEANLNVLGKKFLVDNKAGAEIISEFIGANNNSFATFTLKNAGFIAGGADTYEDVDNDGNDDTPDYGGAAINSRSTLLFTNAVTGLVEGHVETGWFGNKIDNSGRIEGVVRGYIDNDSGVVDLDRDGDFGDFGAGGAINVDDLGTVATIATTLINKGTIYGHETYGHNNQGTDDGGVDDQYFQVAIDLSRGNDVVTNSGKLFGDAWLGHGNDTFTNTGYVRGYVDGWHGNNTITNKGIIEFGVGGQDGNDKLDNTGTINGDVNLNGGNDIFNNSGAVNEWVDLGNGDNTTTNKGTLRHGISSEEGNDTLTNSGTIGNQDHLANWDEVVWMGDGNDKFTNTGTVLGTIGLGGGNDQFIGGKNSDRVRDDGGADSYLLGDGDDILSVFGDDAAVDSFDGGKGYDVINFFNTGGNAVNVNLTTGKVQIGFSPQDNILNFEEIYGTAQSDTFVGSALKDVFYGDDGADNFTGGVGRDFFEGGTGSDTFTYNALNESTVARANRDVIWDFEQGVDKIAILFDANTLVAGPDDFTSLLENVAFSGGAGALRYVWRGFETVIEGDVNGDGKADFSIALTGIIDLDISDFIFN